MDVKVAVRGVPWKRVLDVAIAAGLFTLGAFFQNLFPDAAASIGRRRDLLGILLLVALTAPLIWRQVAPRASLVAILIAWMIDRGLNYEDTLASLSLVIAMHAVGAFLPRRQAIWTAGVTLFIGLAWTTVGIIVFDGISWVALGSIVLWVLLPFAIGRADASTRERITLLELEQQNQAVLNRETADAAVRTERARIARELHDVVAHEITVMTLQAEGARRQSGDADPKVTEALATISDSGRKGLAEMQRMIGVLRDTSELEDDTAPGHLTSFDLTPMPALSSLPALARQVEGSGLPVELHIAGGAHVPAGVELSAYRIVQESLTNALKHAGPGAHATVTVKRARNAVTVTVEDDGRGVVSEATPASGGHGLAGIRERVMALGGSVEFGPRSGGGFRVRAVLPSQDDTVSPRRSRARER